MESVSVSEDGNTITVTLNAEGATTQAIANAINDHNGASQLVTASIDYQLVLKTNAELAADIGLMCSAN